MKYEEKQKIINRICSRLSYHAIEHKGKTYRVRVVDPSIELLVESEHIYDYELDEMVLDGCPNRQELMSILLVRGEWSQLQDSLIETLSDELVKLRHLFNKLRFKKTQRSQIKANIIDIESKLTKLKNKKYLLDNLSAEYIASRKQKLFLIKRSADIIDGDQSLIENDDFAASLLLSYFDGFNIKEETLRNIARSDPWRTIWALSKKGGTPLFKHASCEMTDLQSRLVSWSKVYDFAYEHPEYPGEDIVSDDVMFDAWYTSQTEKINERIKNPNKKEKVSRIDKTPRLSRFGAGEIFIPADKDSVKDVYSMNKGQAKGIVQSRQKQIDKNGRVKHIDMPDVTLDMRTSQNQKRIKNA